MSLLFQNQIDDDGLTYLFGEDPKSDAYFRENFELDMDDEAFSKIDVPDFKNGRMGRFIHEFDSVINPPPYLPDYSSS